MITRTSNEDPLKKVSPKREVTLLACRRVLLPGELHCTAVECYKRRQMTDDDDRRQRAKQHWPVHYV